MALMTQLAKLRDSFDIDSFDVTLQMEVTFQMELINPSRALGIGRDCLLESSHHGQCKTQTAVQG